ncbi:hypothetical protein P152DRAFT_473693 [Eremomyces bilateralis CBS 781.70]|uniref:Uncharacterized protein n=1 Tax=Eremomyces bilateralis CBS 781.70 TaxID=1392243 RepID=A0A6G1G3N8_9PEZI|nr:uncharacterized protein P152DRAFT_473693 [Eremomyces bilateralis CBS 781.70]KAF1812530.1 hypothetical protein P152DRAFT_473693 [Eremomyces bilateralis CBS 781.70]
MDTENLATIVLQGHVDKLIIERAITNALELGFEDAFIVESETPSRAASPCEFFNHVPPAITCRVATQVYTETGALTELKACEFVARRLTDEVDSPASELWSKPPSISTSEARTTSSDATPRRLGERENFRVPGSYATDIRPIGGRRASTVPWFYEGEDPWFIMAIWYV